MKKIALFLLCITYAFSGHSQVIYENFRSIKLDQSRQLKIQLPRNYKKNEDKTYPVILVLDADYLFEPVAGNVDYFSYWEDMPESIVVGIVQAKTRIEDCRYDLAEYLPANEGADFFEFIGGELIPYLDNTYRTARFKMIVGHDLTANFTNYFMFKDNPFFQGYINLSPDLAPPMGERIQGILTDTPTKIWYYMATAANDAENVKKMAVPLSEELSKIENPNTHFFFDNFENATHYTLVGHGIPSALEDIFEIYRPISKKTYKEVILNLGEEKTPYEFLTEKYKTIRDMFGIKLQIRVNDFVAVSTAIEKNKNWEQLEELGKLARKEHPENMLGEYYLGMFYEQTGEPKKAMRTYERGFQLDEVAFLTKDLMLEKVEKIKEDFGW